MRKLSTLLFIFGLFLSISAFVACGGGENTNKVKANATNEEVLDSAVNGTKENTNATSEPASGGAMIGAATNSTVATTNATVAGDTKHIEKEEVTPYTLFGNSTHPVEKAHNATSAAPDTSVLGVGFLYENHLEAIGLAHEHDIARVQLNRIPNVVTTYVDDVATGPDAERIMQSMASKGYGLIVATSAGYKDAALKLAPEYPDVKFLCYSGDVTAANLSTYFGRMYEARFLTGMVAGAMTKTNRIGYVAAFPSAEVISGLNAFTLGAREVNPKAEVKVVWTKALHNPNTERAAVESLVTKEKADVLVQHTDGKTIQELAAELKVYSIGYSSDMATLAPNSHLTAAVWNWTPFYEDIVKKIREGKWEEFDYWGDLATGMVGLAPYGPMVPQNVRGRVDARKQEIIDGKYKVFTGPVLDVSGVERIKSGEVISDFDLRKMDWFVMGVSVIDEKATNENTDENTAGGNEQDNQ